MGQGDIAEGGENSQQVRGFGRAKAKWGEAMEATEVERERERRN
jgi:hypothetical protein